MCGDLALDLADKREGMVPSQFQYQPILGIGGIILPKGPVGGLSRSFMIAAESVPDLIAATSRLRLGLDGSRDRTGLDNLQKGFFNGVINTQPAKGDAARLAVVEQAPPAGIARDVVVGAGISHRELAAAAPAADKPGKQRITMLGRSMMPDRGHIIAHYLADRLRPLPTDITFMAARDQRQPRVAGPIGRTTRHMSSRRTERSCVGWLDIDATPASPPARELSRFYRSMRLFVNFFQPSFKLREKRRDGAQVTKRYHPPLTPYQRVLGHPDIAQTVKDELSGIFGGLVPVELLAEIRQSQARLTKLADEGPQPEDVNPKADVARFLEGLRHAWKDGEVRPTARSRPVAPRGRRRPDPLERVTTELRLWFEQDPSQTGRELLEKLQNAHFGSYPDRLLRTVQRRSRPGAAIWLRPWCLATPKWTARIGWPLTRCAMRWLRASVAIPN